MIIRNFKAALLGEESAAQVMTVVLINGVTYGEIAAAPLTAGEVYRAFSSSPFARYILGLM